jgi:hypothetical protein
MTDVICYIVTFMLDDTSHVVPFSLESEARAYIQGLGVRDAQIEALRWGEDYVISGKIEEVGHGSE